jgi:mannose-6-phosphate isomerase class I
MFKVIRASEGVIRQIAKNKTATNLITKDICPEISLATTDGKDYYEAETSPYNRIYYVLAGELEIIVGTELHKLQKGDTCFIGKNTPYEMCGTFNAIVVNQPAFGSKA